MSHDLPAAPPDWFTEALAVPVVTGITEVDGCDIAFRRWGDPGNPGLLLVHGGRAHSRWWDHVAPFFSKECCVTALDLSGHGDSGRRPKYLFENWAEEIAVLASQTAAGSGRPPVVVAHSLGGHATFFAAAEYPGAFEGIMVVDSPVRDPSPDEDASYQQWSGPLRVYPTRVAALARFRMWPDAPSSLPYVTRHVAEMSIRQTAEGWTWKFDPTYSAHVGQLHNGGLAQVSCRVAILRAQFGLLTAEIGAEMHEALGRTAPVVEIPLAHHHVMLDEPISLVTAVRSLLADWRHSSVVRAPD